VSRQSPCPAADRTRGVDGREQRPRLVASQFRGLAFHDGVFLTTDRCGRIHDDDVAVHHDIEKRPQRSQVLLFGRNAARMIAEIHTDMARFNVAERLAIRFAHLRNFVTARR